MRDRGPQTYRGAVLWAAAIIGAPLALHTVLDLAAGDLSWSTLLLRLLLWIVVSALLTLAFSGGVEPRSRRPKDR